MKDLTHYFVSPTGKNKKTSLNNEEEENAIIKEDVVLVDTAEDKTDKRNSGSSKENTDINIEDEKSGLNVNMEPVKTYKGKKRGRKKKVGRKHSDPAVKNITELLSNSLNLISPNGSFSENVTEIAEKIKEATSVIEENPVIIEDQEELSPKKNAFQFIMESRKLSIGMNSSGKEKEELSPSTECKEKLKARKSLLESWAEIKGASKRKRQEEEKEIFIDHQMQKRAKRLKNLLQLDESEETPANKRKRNTRRISESDDSEGIEESSKSSGNLLSFLGTIKKTEKEIEVVEETPNEIFKVKMFTPKKSKKTKKSRLNKKSPKKKKEDPLLAPENPAEETNVLCEDTASNDSVKPKRGRKKKILENSKPIIVDEESCDSVKPKRGRKKKVAIIDDSSQDTQLSLTPKSAKQGKINMKNKDLLNSQSEEIDKDKRVLRVRKQKIVESDEDWEEERKTTTKKPSKIAPVFLKAAPKPKIDPEIAEARRQFLMSGIPDSLKKTIEKQQSIEEKDFDVFPSIQHVQQKCGSEYWNLPKPNLKLIKDVQFIACKNNIFKGFMEKQKTPDHVKIPKRDKIANFKNLIEDIKVENPDYPVYKSFRQIYEKSGYQNEKCKTKKRRSKKGKKSLDKSVEIVEVTPEKIDPTKYAMWTDKYKPKSSEDILGNFSSTKALKNFLEAWLQFSKDIIAKKRKKRADSSESEFDVTDCDSRDSAYFKLPGNSLILNGSVGSGKSAAVYAVCNELGLKVLEMNASSKRTGKKLLQDMQEATQSHQVKNQSSAMQTFFKSKEAHVEQPKAEKMCVILIEDVDLIFEQDESFITALSTLVTITKRPIIMTTTDIASPYAQKFAAQYEVVNFAPLQTSTLSTWLKIVCLVEGFLVDQNSLGILLEVNKGDARKTLLNLQFWLQSGGQTYQNNEPMSCAPQQRQSSDFKPSDDVANDFLGVDEDPQEKPLMHFYLLNKTDYIITLGNLWWNTPNLLSLPIENTKRLNKFGQINLDNTPTTNEECMPKKSNGDLDELKKIGQFFMLHDTLALVDEMQNKIHLDNTWEPCVKNRKFLVKDSLNLDDKTTDYTENYDSMDNLTHTLVDLNVGMISDNFSCNMVLPDQAEKRWRAKNHICEDILKEATPLSTSKGPLSLDYMPYLRDMSRSEHHRSLNNTKRSKRFYHYLKTVGVDFNDAASKLACNVLY